MVFLVGCVLSACNRREELPRNPAHDVPFEQTTVTPHPFEELRPGVNTVYCGTMKLAWNEITNAGFDTTNTSDPSMVLAMNRLSFGKTDLDEASYLAMFASGDEIGRAMQQKFPGVQLGQDWSPGGQEKVAFAYLLKSLRFREKFDVRPEPLRFAGPREVVSVKAFGLKNFSESNQRDTLHLRQVSILDYRNDDDFVLRLNTLCVDDELILAKVKPLATLDATINAVAKRAQRPYNDKRARLQDDEDMIVPIINLDIESRFAGLEAPGWRARQVIRFRLDESGAKLESFAYYDGLGIGGNPREFVFDKPFLVYLKRRDSDNPYFVMWIENAEVLERADADDLPE